MVDKNSSKKNYPLLWGDDFTFMNAASSYKQIEQAIQLCNNFGNSNIEFVQSTPQTFVNALKAENIEFPVKYDDLYPYASKEGKYWTGFFSSRPTFKKQVRDTSAALGAHSHIFARRVID